MAHPSATLSHLSRRRLIALAVFVTVLWSSSWVLIRVGLDNADLPPLAFAALRYAIAVVVLAAWIRTRAAGAPARRPLSRSAWPIVAALGVVQYAVTQGAQFVAIGAQPAATTSLLLACTPLIVVVLSGVVLDEQPTVAQIVAGLVVVIGAICYFRGELGATAVGLTAAVVALCGNAAAVMLGRSVARSGRFDMTRLTLASMGVGAALLLVVGVALDGVPRFSATALGVVMWLALVNTAAAFTWWNVCLRQVPASEMAAINTTMAVQIPVLGWVVLGEPLGPAESVGLALVVVGVVVITRSSNRRPRPCALPTGR